MISKYILFCTIFLISCKNTHSAQSEDNVQKRYYTTQSSCKAG